MTAEPTPGAPPPSHGPAYKIVAASDWATVPAYGGYSGSEVDLRDGYIHLSTEAQWRETAARHFGGTAGLLLLSVDLDRLGEGVVWEPSRGGTLFPHFYGPLPRPAVTAWRTLAVGTDGDITLGPLSSAEA